MVLEFLQPFLSGQAGLLILAVIFILFIIIVRKTVKILLSAIWIAIISAIFPVAANYLLGFTFPLNIDTFIFFITLGVGLFALYLFAKLIYGILGIAGKAGSAMSYPFRARSNAKKEKTIKEAAKLVKKDKEEEKRKKKLEKNKK